MRHNRILINVAKIADARMYTTAKPALIELSAFIEDLAENAITIIYFEEV